MAQKGTVGVVGTGIMGAPMAVNLAKAGYDVIAYNRAAQRVMAARGVRSNDLYSFALSRLAEIQRPVNVHFTGEGSDALAGQVAKMIAHALKR